MTLEGTDLFSAFQPFHAEQHEQHEQHEKQQEQEIFDKPQREKPSSVPSKSNVQNNQASEQDFNKMFEQQQRVNLAIQQMKRQQIELAQQQQQALLQNNVQNAVGSQYLDKVFSDKRGFLKLIQFALIIVLALSIHALIKFLLKNYIKSNDFSFQRIIGLKLLYVFATLFILWNIKVFIKN